VGEESFEERRAISTSEMEVIADQEAMGPICDTTTYRFWGGSEILNPFGINIANAKLYEEDEIYAEIQRDFIRRKRIVLPYLRNDDPYFTHRELQRILYKKFVKDSDPF
jgi:predicted amidohydrolase